MKTNTSSNLIACAVIAGAFTVGFASGQAGAQTRINAPEPFKFDFAFDAAEMGDLRGAESLLMRLQTAVSTHCGGTLRMSLNERKVVERCVDQTMQQAVSKFGNATLAQAYKSRADG